MWKLLPFSRHDLQNWQDRSKPGTLCPWTRSGLGTSFLQHCKKADALESVFEGHAHTQVIGTLFMII
ncbi:unnamed protein product [Victoria cruziana]